jgi:hypothetical protein
VRDFMPKQVKHPENMNMYPKKTIIELINEEGDIENRFELDMETNILQEQSFIEGFSKWDMEHIFQVQGKKCDNPRQKVSCIVTELNNLRDQTESIKIYSPE